MRLLQLSIRGFRGIREATVRFDEQTVLIGPNGCGKTTIIEALALVLGRDRMIRTLTEHDFFGSNPDPATRIVIIATLGGFPDNSEERNRDWFRHGRAVPKWWDEATRTILPEPCENGVLCGQIGFSARFDRETLTVESVRYFHDDDSVIDPFLEDNLERVPGRLLSEVGFFLVPATRTWDRMLSFGSELFRRVVTANAGLPSEELIAERDRLRNPVSPIEGTGTLGALISRINDELALLLPEAPVCRLRITNTDSDSVLQALLPHYQCGAGPIMPAIRHGSGLLSLQTLILLLEFGRARHDAEQSFILGIEEPELHLPPGLQRRMLHRAHAVASQVICTSHAPRVASFFKPTELRVVRTEAGLLEATPLLDHPLGDDATNSLRKLLTDQRQQVVEALMHPAVLIPEGRIDYEWLRLLCDLTETSEASDATGQTEQSSFGTAVGIVPTPDASVATAVELLGRVHSRIAALVDGDEAGNRYVASLLQMDRPPHVVIQWLPGKTIEDIVGWIVAADTTNILPKINNILGTVLGTCDDLVNALKETDRSQGGLKGNYLAYEGINSMLGLSLPCLERACAFLQVLKKGAVSDAAGETRLIRDERSTRGCRVLRLTL